MPEPRTTEASCVLLPSILEDLGEWLLQQIIEDRVLTTGYTASLG